MIVLHLIVSQTRAGLRKWVTEENESGQTEKEAFHLIWEGSDSGEYGDQRYDNLEVVSKVHGCVSCSFCATQNFTTSIDLALV